VFVSDAQGMPHHAASETAGNDTIAPLESADASPASALAHPASGIIELLGMAVDANELAARIQAGEGNDLNGLIQRAIDERPTLDSIASLKTAA